jgi:hypothetical protein
MRLDCWALKIKPPPFERILMSKRQRPLAIISIALLVLVLTGIVVFTRKLNTKHAEVQTLTPEISP